MTSDKARYLKKLETLEVKQAEMQALIKLEEDKYEKQGELSSALQTQLDTISEALAVNQEELLKLQKSEKDA